MKKILLLFVLASVIMSCNPKNYVTSDYQRYAQSHRTIAVLPFENNYTGRMTKDMTEEDVLALRTEEAVLFQRSLYFQLLEESRASKKKGIRISIQNIDQTNKILEDNNISIQESWFESPTELAQKLGVDAVVKVDMHKDYWLTNGESAAIDIATTVTGIFVPGVSNRFKRTSEIYINANLLDADEGVSLWAWNRKIDTDWQCETDEAISRVNHQISKRFPYRDNL